ncbi:putative zinc finger protein [Clavispora lusitaniae]|uniref:Zn(2)-C6 fungal-type domain-containing protein n=2 Tax=Clavispora lusitaniae TaxID=36911 RepID=C4YC70_CLAL4|nr:uncharacterized protein CLUG_05887 [Clavispora lusitaniae ATCC 42720]KAF7580465.1 Fungal Zn(2)-Cys(6) binuclear cluster domain family protein [Clavispora lusitaniae]EEQ41759.1 predicted protein [Clavispora lusitaniae ATCC 42720]QFZ30337.1 putative zinc finger protein [Clavispora lusitaniae]QFZ35999.1 putative zinc finger protein [Clavispora lusitaniae]QFZ41683.1 putative zinc finger protein [Clavispora lusitaniae]
MMVAHKRSRDGCFTCRRRKKKCDEASYPKCHNCQANKLDCSWPEHVTEKHKDKEEAVNTSATPDKKLETDRFVDTGISLLSSAITKPHSPRHPASSHSNLHEQYQEAESHKRINYILQRIAMQQDCVDEKTAGPEDVVPVFESSTKTNAIHKRIAQQMDIGDHYLGQSRSLSK